ncbi:MAG: dephospho-CoA kinase [Paracoccaceae bacterium]|jgi:dephospho-CoA kinase
MSAFKLGLTGSIGMGKTTTAALFAKHGGLTWCADAAVHRLYGLGGAAVESISLLVPSALQNGIIDRAILKSAIASDVALLSKIEAIIHPLVAKDRAAFLIQHQTGLLVFDVPLLFETGVDKMMDAVVVVTSPPAVQRQRVLARGTMTGADLDLILAHQMSDVEKQNLADYVIKTDTLGQAEQLVLQIIKSPRFKNA